MLRIAFHISCFLAALVVAAEPGHAQSPMPRPSDVADYKAPAKSFALVIGNDSYPGAKLENARSDAKLVAETLKSTHGFEVEIGLDLDSGALRKRIRDFLDFKGQDPDTRLLLWFAGHGTLVTVNKEEHGVLLPIDAPTKADENNRAEILNEGVDVSWLRDRIQRFVPARHVLVMLDSCASGAITARRVRGRSDGVSTLSPPERWNGPVRQIITAGAGRQEVFDDGRFAQAFVRAITGQSPSLRLQHPGFLTGGELGNHLRDHFQINHRGEQNPVSTFLYDREGGHHGEFVFKLKRSVVTGRWSDVFGKDIPKVEPAAAITTELAALAQRCVVGSPHRTPIKAAREVVHHTSPRRHIVVHRFEERQKHPTRGTDVDPKPIPVHSVEVEGSLIHVTYGETRANGEMLLTPVQDDPGASPDAGGSVLLQGAWSRDGNDGCVEFRLKLGEREEGKIREGQGLIWIGLRNRRGVQVPGITKTPLRSVIRIEPKI